MSLKICPAGWGEKSLREILYERAFVGSHVTKQKRIHMAANVYKCLNHGKKFNHSPQSIIRHKPWGKQASLVLMLMLSVFKCHLFVLHEISFKFIWSKHFWNHSLLDLLFEVQKWLWKSWGQSCERALWNHLQPEQLSLHLLSSCCLLYSVDYSGPCWNGGFGFGLVLEFLFCFVWNVWCFKLSIRWLWDQLCQDIVVYDTLSMASIIVFQYQAFPDVQSQYLLVILHKPGTSNS